jgi:hypothetical protein
MRKQAPTFEKEILSETEIVKGGKTYKITSENLDNCVTQYRRMKQNGVKVNVHSGHDHTPETKRGEVLDLYTRRRRDGRVGLFGKICFLPHLSKQTIQTLVSNDVSVELPQHMCDARGNSYSFPVQRVAITPDPAVSGMSPFVQQQDTPISVPFLTLSINNLLPEEQNTMQSDNPQLFDPATIDQQEPLPGTSGNAEMGTETDTAEEAQQALATGKKKSAFLESQLAKTLFDALGIEPDDYTAEELLVSELNLRLASTLTLQSRLLAALDIDEEDKNKFELLSSKVTALVEFLDQYDHDNDGIVDEEDVQQGAESDPTIDGTLNQLEANDQNLKLSLNALQKKYAESATVIKTLMAHNRQLQLDNMLQVGEINKIAHEKAVKKFVLKLSLADGFDDFIDGAKTNAHGNGHSKTLPQQATPVDSTALWTQAAQKVAAPYRRAEPDSQ